MGETAVERSRHGVGKPLAVLGVAVCAVGIVLLVKGLYPVDLSLTKDPDFIDRAGGE